MRRPVARPLSVLAAAGTAAHHGFELGNGVGLVWQPELGLVPAGLFWTLGLGAWSWVAARGSRRWDGVLAALAGAGLAGVVVHFTLWPWRLSRWGVPLLTGAEGLPASRLGAYNAILGGWALASVASLAELTPSRRRWALLGLAGLPLLRRSARHHFAWASARAVDQPAWWNRGLRDGGGGEPAGMSATPASAQVPGIVGERARGPHRVDALP